MKWLLGYGAAALVFVVVDFLWLTVVARVVYRPELAAVLADDVNYAAAVIFYVIYIAGIMTLAVHPGAKANSLGLACFNGAMLGLVAYATYDLSNLATLKVWSIKVTVIDIAWGAFLSALAAAAGYLAFTRSPGAASG